VRLSIGQKIELAARTMIVMSEEREDLREGKALP
jgi:hypothetical protein